MSQLLSWFFFEHLQHLLAKSILKSIFVGLPKFFLEFLVVFYLLDDVSLTHLELLKFMLTNIFGEFVQRIMYVVGWGLR
jgi:hypothetical protein